MKIKKGLCIGLALALTVCTLPHAALANERDKQQSALAAVRERIPDTSDFEHFDSESTQGEGGVTTYHFNWSSQKEDNYVWMSVSCTQSGLITSYYAYADDDYDDRRTINKLAEAEALSRAQALADALNPMLKGTVRVEAYERTESLYDNGFSFTLQRYENGLPFYGQTGMIRVNKTADRIESYSIDYDETLPVPAANGLLSQAAANAAFTDKLGMELVYKSYVKDRERILYPVYIPAGKANTYIDAKTGEAVDLSSDIWYAYDNGRGAAGDALAKEQSFSFSAAELAELDNIEGLLDSDAVLRAIRANTLLAFPADVDLVRTSRSKDIYADAYYYTYWLEHTAEDVYTSASVTADARTGALCSFYTYIPRDDEKQPAIKPEALTAAAKTLCGERFAEYKPDESNTGSNTARFVRFVNGVRFDEDGVSVTLEPKTGKVTSYSCTYTDATFPSVDGVLSAAQASAKLLEQVDYAPCYMARYTKDGGAQTALVYRLDTDKPHHIDAFSGVLLNGYSDEAYTEERFDGYTDIDGHYAKTQIETLARFGIRFAGDTFKPDEKITQAEYIGLLTAAFYYGGAVIDTKADSVQSAYRQARNAHILTDAERDDTAEVTRADAAKYLIRALGIEEYANLEGIYLCPFDDVTDCVGQISILGAMHVFNGDGTGHFYPQQALTRADAAILIYNYLSR